MGRNPAAGAVVGRLRAAFIVGNDAASGRPAQTEPDERFRAVSPGVWLPKRRSAGTFARDRAVMPCDKPRMATLTANAIRAALPAVPLWRKRGAVIRRTFTFADFPPAMKFVNAVARLAEKAGHHPDIDIRWNRVTLALTTHDAGGLTAKDFELAARLDRLV
jgi:4a-hydroxytetrahydrobiopterin dehydratase